MKSCVLADTIGIADPTQVRKYKTNQKLFLIWNYQFIYMIPGGLGVNTLAAIEEGVTNVETALGGLGGCPTLREQAQESFPRGLLYGTFWKWDMRQVSIFIKCLSCKGTGRRNTGELQRSSYFHRKRNTFEKTDNERNKKK